MTAQLIDGKAFAQGIRDKVGAAVGRIKQQHGLTPGLAVVLVGDDPASQTYVRNKQKALQEAGMYSRDVRLSAATDCEELLSEINKLNADASIHGILVQLPLPRKEDTEAVINAVDPAKDVDGFHDVNVQKLKEGRDGAVPCTPLGCLLLLKSRLGDDLSGKQAVVLGRSKIVGAPMAELLRREGCKVEVCHSQTPDPAAVTRGGDIVVAAVGKVNLVRGDWIKKGAIVIDVGINSITKPDGKPGLAGDVAREEVMETASAVTPVPGGVWPMTIACLVYNTLKAACAQKGIDCPLSEKDLYQVQAPETAFPASAKA